VKRWSNHDDYRPAAGTLDPAGPWIPRKIGPFTLVILIGSPSHWAKRVCLFEPAEKTP
jgi:hypothetical protein